MKYADRIKIVSSILLAMVLVVQTVSAVPFACFADGYVFNDDGTPVENGTLVNITSIVSHGKSEHLTTHTGYPLYPPVEEYNNQYKAVFTCSRGVDSVKIVAYTATHIATGEVLVPEDGQAFLNLTLKPRRQETLGLINIIKTRIVGIVKYFLGKSKKNRRERHTLT